MRIVHIISGLSNGGAEAALVRLVRTPSSDEHVIMSLGSLGHYGEILRGLGFKVIDINLSVTTVLRGLVRLREEVLIANPDIVQTWMYHSDLIGSMVAWVSGRKTIVWSNHHAAVDANSIKRRTRLISWVCSWLSWHVPRAIISCANAAMNAHIKAGYDPSKYIVIPNGYDTVEFSVSHKLRSEFRSELGIADSVPLLGFVARYDPQKDHKNLLEAIRISVKIHDHLLCCLVGAGCTVENLELMGVIRELGLESNLILLGQRSDVPRVMNGIDIHVLSSYTEAFPNVVAEAMACSTPCIVTNVGDAADIVGSTGWVVPSRDSLALSDAIVTAVYAISGEGWGFRKEMARRRIVENFDISKIYAGFRNVWVRALSSG